MYKTQQERVKNAVVEWRLILHAFLSRPRSIADRHLATFPAPFLGNERDNSRIRISMEFTRRLSFRADPGRCCINARSRNPSLRPLFLQLARGVKTRGRGTSFPVARRKRTRLSFVDSADRKRDKALSRFELSEIPREFEPVYGLSRSRDETGEFPDVDPLKLGYGRSSSQPRCRISRRSETAEKTRERERERGAKKKKKEQDEGNEEFREGSKNCRQVPEAEALNAISRPVLHDGTHTPFLSGGGACTCSTCVRVTNEEAGG